MRCACSSSRCRRGGIGVFGMPFDDDARELVVGVRAAKLAAAEVDAGDQIAVGTVAVRARSTLIHARAVLDVERGGVLRGRGPRAGNQGSGAEREGRDVTLHVATR